MELPSAVTHDSISLRGAGIITVVQPAKGHRFTLDSILLADFCSVRPMDRVLEPGAGTGIVSLLLAKKHPRATFTCLELQPALASLCGQNAAANRLSGRVQVLQADLGRLGRGTGSGTFSVIVANPPYIKDGSGRTSPHAGRRTARQEHAAPLEAWLSLHRHLKNGGRYCLVFPATRSAELVYLLGRKKLEPKRLRMVHPLPGKPASLVLIEAVKNAGPGVAVSPPLIVHEADGGFTAEMRDIYGLTENSRS